MNNTRDIMLLYKHAKGGKWGKKIVQGIVLVSLWSIWKARNEKTFMGAEPKVNLVIGSIKALSFLWLKNRSKFNDLLWEDWCNCPLYML